MEIQDKLMLTVKEAVDYSGIGRDRLYQIINEDPTIDWAVRKGSHFMVKRKQFEEWISNLQTV